MSNGKGTKERCSECGLKIRGSNHEQHCKLSKKRRHGVMMKNMRLQAEGLQKWASK